MPSLMDSTFCRDSENQHRKFFLKVTVEKTRNNTGHTGPVLCKGGHCHWVRVMTGLLNLTVLEFSYVAGSKT